MHRDIVKFLMVQNREMETLEWQNGSEGVECLEVVTQVREKSEGFQTHEPTFLPIMLSYEQKPLDDYLDFTIRWIFFEDDLVLEYRSL